MMMRRAAGTLIFALVCVALGVGIALVTATRISLPDNKPIPIISGELLYQQHCAGCHGEDGLGIAGRAPALNNPQYFGFDYMAAWNEPIQKAYTQAEDFQLQREAAFAGLADDTLTRLQLEALAMRIRTLDDYLWEESPQYVFRDIDRLIAEREEFIAQLTPELGYRNYLPGVELFYAASAQVTRQEPAFSQELIRHGNRLRQVQWRGDDIRTFTYFAIAGGRPGSNTLWDNPMPAFSNLTGGPFSDDELWALTDYIMQWDKGNVWGLDDLLAVRQFAKIAQDPDIIVEPVPAPNLAHTLNTIYENGDARRGAALYNNEMLTEVRAILGCGPCHDAGIHAPSTETMWNNIINERLSLPEFNNYTPERYLIEAVLVPNSYIVSPYSSGIMPNRYDSLMSAQDLADVIAYLRSFADDK